MQIDYIDPAEIFVMQVRRAPPGAILFQSTFDYGQALRLIALEPGEDKEDEPKKVYIKLEDDGQGFGCGDANLNDVDVGVTCWRVEVDPASAKNTGIVRPKRGDLILRQGLLSLVIWDGRGRPFWLNLTDYTLGGPMPDDVTTTVFSRWRIVKDVETHDRPILVFERKPTTEG